MRITKTLGLICCSLILGVANITVAADHDIRSGSEFSSGKKVKANDLPRLWMAFSIPGNIAPGDEFRVNCLIEAQKNKKGAPQKNLKGSVSLLAISLDLGSLTWAFTGVAGSGLPFTTDKDGVAVVTTGPSVAGDWANNPGSNDTITGWVNFTNSKKVMKANFGCELVPETAATVAAR